MRQRNIIDWLNSMSVGRRIILFCAVLGLVLAMLFVPFDFTSDLKPEFAGWEFVGNFTVDNPPTYPDSNLPTFAGVKIDLNSLFI